MTNPTAAAAKLLAQAQYQRRKPGDPIERPILYFDEAGYREGPAIMWINPYSGEAEAVCAFFWPSHPPEETNAVEILWEDFGNSFVASWNTRPQPAPPAGEPDFKSDAGQFVADHFAVGGIIHDWATPTGLGEFATEITTEFERMYRLGLAARPKVEDAELTEVIDRCRRYVTKHRC